MRRQWWPVWWVYGAVLVCQLPMRRAHQVDLGAGQGSLGCVLVSLVAGRRRPVR